MGMRDYAMIMLAYTTGLRGCDIVNLKFDSIDWDACELRLVQEKTNIPVSLPLGTKTGNAIADYILHARPKCKSEYIFLRVLRPYTKIGSMWTVIAKYAHIALGKDRKMNGPHAFRRGMGRQLLETRHGLFLFCRKQRSTFAVTWKNSIRQKIENETTMCSMLMVALKGRCLLIRLRHL